MPQPALPSLLLTVPVSPTRLGVRGAYPGPVDFDTRVGCYAWIEQDGHVLLTHWRALSAAGREVAGWTLPGGGVEVGESPETTCVREVYEETGFTAELEELLGVRNHWVEGEQRWSGDARPLQGLQVVYLARITAGALTVEVDGSTDDVRWVALDDLPGMESVSLVGAAAAWAGARRAPT